MLNWQIGVEIELIAPRGLSRETLAQKLCPASGSIKRFFHPQSEPSKIPNTPIFENLTLGFEVLDSQGNLIAQCVDDLTLQQDCQSNMPAKPGWYRIVSDDRRLLELVRQQCEPKSSLTEVLNPIAHLFNTQPEYGQGNMVKVVDSNGSPIAIATPLPGERERPCEIITPPLQHNYLESLEKLLNPAVDLGFTIPQEGAIHIHFDAVVLASTRVFCNLVNLLWTHGNNLRHLVKTNLHCQRLGKLPESLFELVNHPSFQQLSWSEAKTQLTKLPLSKYCDFNLKNLVYGLPNKYTFEARIFPVCLEAESIILAAELIEAILNQAIDLPYIPPQETLNWDLAKVTSFLSDLPLSPATGRFWQYKAITHDF